MSPEPTLPTKKLPRWNTGVCGIDSRPHLENENHICRGWHSTLDLPEPTLPVSQPNPIQQAENWLLTRRNYVGQQVKHRGDCGKGVVNHACELCRLSIMLPTYANYLDSARDRELQQAREANELIQGQMRTLNEECAQLRKDCVRSGEEIARLKEALTKS